MIRTHPNVVMASTATRASPAEAIHLINNYLSTINSSLNAYAPNAYNTNQNGVAVSSFNFNPGMKDVPQWLKSLRLHKYTSIFMDLTYEQMLGLDEKILEQRGVTMGARGKILQSISKLKRRPHIIREMITQLDASKDPECRCPIIHLRQFISTPIRNYKPEHHETHDKIDGNCNVDQINDNNIPALLVLLLQKVQSFIINCRQGEVSDDYILMLYKTHDLILSNEAFTENQKRRVTHLKKQAKKYVCTGRKSLGVVPTGKCEFCTARDALVGPMPLADVLPPSPTQRPKEKKRGGNRESRRNKGRLPDLEIGEWKPTSPNVKASSTFDLTNMSQCLNLVHQPTPIQKENYQAMLQFAQHPYGQDLLNYMTAQSQQQQPNPLGHTENHWNNIYSTSRDLHCPEPAALTLITKNPSVDSPEISHIPQYRSWPAAATPTSVMATRTGYVPMSTSQMEKDKQEPRWPTTLYNNSDLAKMARSFSPVSKIDTSINLSYNLRNKTESGENTSGYCSSASERGSGAGSPRSQEIADTKEKLHTWSTWDPCMSRLFLDMNCQLARC